MHEKIARKKIPQKLDGLEKWVKARDIVS